MLDQPIRSLLALEQTRSLQAAAVQSGTTVQALRDAIRLAEAEFGCPLVEAGLEFSGFTQEGEQVLAWARSFERDCDTLRSDLRRARLKAAMAPLLERRSVSPKRLGTPGPNAEEIDLLLQAALRAPDHGGLHPWRVVEFAPEQRAALADRFEQEKLRRDPLASDRDRLLAREHATRPPALLAFVVSPQLRSKVPMREQWLAAGAALGNLLNAAHRLGFGAIMLSGERCFDAVLTAELGVRAEESLAGFVSLGRVAEVPPARHHASPAAVWSGWQTASAVVPGAPQVAGNSLHFE